MLKQIAAFGIVMLAVVVMAIPAQALIVQSYTPQRHDRFYVGGDKDFVGAPYDFSGLGTADASGSVRYAAMVSPSYFITANHFHAGNGSVMNFFYTNDPNGPSEQHTVASGQKIDGSDIWLGKLATPVSSAVAKYDIPLLNQQSDYLQQEVVSVGHSNTSPAVNNIRVGRNVISFFSNLTLGGSTGLTLRTTNSGAAGFDPDEAQVQGGDSGAPVFLTLGGQLSLAGIHWATSGTSSSWDSFVPDHFNSIQAIVQANGESLGTIPEPTTLALFSVMAIGLGWRRRAA